MNEAEEYYTRDWLEESKSKSEADARSELAKCQKKLDARMSKPPTEGT